MGSQEGEERRRGREGGRGEVARLGGWEGDPETDLLGSVGNQESE